MTKNKDVKILALVGMSGSGKSTAIDYLIEKNIPKIYFGGVIYKAMAEAGIERSEDGESEKKFREEIRQKEGKDFVVKRAIKEAKDLIAAGQKRIVLDGLYSWTEYKILRKEFPTEMTVVAVVVPKALRRHRLAIRPDRPFDAQAAAEQAEADAVVAQGKAETAQGAAETAQGKAEQAQAKADEYVNKYTWDFDNLGEVKSIKSVTLKTTTYNVNKDQGDWWDDINRIKLIKIS